MGHDIAPEWMTPAVYRDFGAASRGSTWPVAAYNGMDSRRNTPWLSVRSENCPT